MPLSPNMKRFLHILTHNWPLPFFVLQAAQMETAVCPFHVSRLKPVEQNSQQFIGPRQNTGYKQDHMINHEESPHCCQVISFAMVSLP